MSYRPQIKTSSTGTLKDLPIDAETVKGIDVVNTKANASDVYTKTETDNGINKPLYNLGAYDTISGNVITRQTGYVDLGTLSWSEVDTNCWKSVVSNFPNIYTSGKVIVGEKYKSASITDYSGFIALGVGYIGMLSTYEYIICMSNGKPTGLAQYKLSTSYTEEIIEGQPLITLDQQGSQWLRNEWEKGLNLFSGGVSLMDKGLVVGKQYIITTKNNTRYNFKIATFSNAVTGSVEVLNEKNNTSIFIFTWNTNKNWNLYVFDTNWVLQNNDDIEIMLNEGTIALPYQPYNSKAHITNYEADFLKNESLKSANLFDDNGTNSIQYIGRFYTNDTSANYVLSPHDNYDCFRIRVEQNKTYYIKEINGLILRFEDINNNLVGGLSLFNTGYGSFTTPNGCNYVVFSKAISLATNVTMLNEGSVALPYQPYEGKVVHEKELGGYVTTDTQQTITNYKKFTKGFNVGIRDDTGIFPYLDDGHRLLFKSYGSSVYFYCGNDSGNYTRRLELIMPLGGTEVTYAITFPKKNGTIALTNDFKTINGNSIVGSGDLAITPSIFTLLNSNATNVSLSLDKTYLVIAYTGPVRVYGENSDYGSSGSKTFSGVFMVTVVRTVSNGESVYVNTQAVFSEEYLTGASISGSSFKIYKLN